MSKGTAAPRSSEKRSSKTRVHGQGKKERKVSTSRSLVSEHRSEHRGSDQEPKIVQIWGEIELAYPQYVPQEDVEQARFCFCFCKRRSIRRTFMFRAEGDLIEALALQILWIIIILVIARGRGASLADLTTEDIAFFVVYGISTAASILLGPICVCISRSESGWLIMLHIFLAILVTTCQVVMYILVWIHYNVQTYTLQFLVIGVHYVYTAWYSHILYRRLFQKNVAWDDPFQRPNTARAARGNQGQQDYNQNQINNQKLQRGDVESPRSPTRGAKPPVREPVEKGRVSFESDRIGPVPGLTDAVKGPEPTDSEVDTEPVVS